MGARLKSTLFKLSEARRYWETWTATVTSTWSTRTLSAITSFEPDHDRSGGDLTGDGNVDFDDFHRWKDYYPVNGTAATATVPEPAAGMVIVGLLFAWIGLPGQWRQRFETIVRVHRLMFVVGMLAFAAAPVMAQVNVDWQVASGDYASTGNWVGGILPDAGFDEKAVIGNATVATATANVSSVITGNQRPGGVDLGSGAGTTGTLNINSGGNLTVIAGSAAAGNMTLGISDGVGILNVNPGGSLTARRLIVSGVGSGSERQRQRGD